MRSLATILVFVLAGGAAGGVVAALSASLTASRSRADKAVAAPEEMATKVELVNVGAPLQDMQAMAREIQDLRARVSVREADSGTTPSAAAPEGPVPEEQHEAQLKLTTATFHAALAQHDKDPVDPRWAAQTAGLLKKDFGALATHGKFDVRSIDCRTTTCVADIAFKDRQTAVTNWQSILGKHLSVNCGVQVVLDAEAKDDEPYPTRVLMDCEDARAEATN